METDLGAIQYITNASGVQKLFSNIRYEFFFQIKKKKNKKNSIKWKTNKQTAFIINIWHSTTVFLYDKLLMKKSERKDGKLVVWHYESQSLFHSLTRKEERSQVPQIERLQPLLWQVQSGCLRGTETENLNSLHFFECIFVTLYYRSLKISEK